MYALVNASYDKYKYSAKRVNMVPVLVELPD